MRICLHFFLLLHFCFLFSEDEAATASLFSLDTEPSAIVNGSVNVIGGDYCESQVDLIVQGPNPIVFQRNYSSSGMHRNSYDLGACWKINHRYAGEMTRRESSLEFKTFGIEKGVFTGKQKKKSEFSELEASKNDFKKAAVNTSSGAMSARTNVLNSKVFYRSNGNGYETVCKWRLADGTMRHFTFEGVAGSYLMTKEVQPEKNAIAYNWCKVDGGKEISKITALNAENQEFGSVNLIYGKHGKTFQLSACNGQKVDYSISRDYVRWSDNKRHLLKDVKSPFAPPIHYTYRHKNYQIKRRELPEKRYLEIEYYDEGENRIGKKKKYLNPGDIRIGRVKLQKAPVGLDEKPIITHRFFYHVDSETKNKKLIQKSGHVDVFDAYDHKTTYRFGKDHRLHTLEKYDENASLYSKERLFWSGKNQDDRTRLMGRVFEDGQGKVHCNREFVYDAQGNILEDRLYGNLTGTSNEKIIISPEGRQTNKKAECFTKCYRYNAKNLMTEEIEGNKSTFYTYDLDRDLLTSKLTAAGGKILHREFYEYDKNGVNVKKIIDNGSSIDKNNLKGITERHILTTNPTTTFPIGLPRVQEERYLDLNLGKEKLLKRHENTFDSMGRMTSKKVYDSNGVFAFETAYTYDSHGNLLEEVDPLGRITTRRYDANDNLIFEQGPSHEFHKEFVYDYSNRLIREEVVFANGKRDVTSHAYDYLSNRIKSVDRYGNATSYTYDAFGRLIQVNEPEGYIRNNEYDVLSHPILTVEPNGGKTKSTFTLRGQPVRVNYEDGSSESFEYAVDGALLKQVAKNGSYILLKHDIFGNITEKNHFSKKGEFLFSTSASYDVFHLLSECDAAGNVTYYFYDGAGRLVEKRSSDQRICYEYDSLNRVSKTIDYYNDDDAKVFVQERNIINQIIEERTENLAGEVLKKINYSYDVMGNKTEVIAETSSGIAVARSFFNPYKQLVLEVDPEGKETQFVYGERDAITFVDRIDCTAMVIHTEFDAHGQAILTETKNPFGEVLQREVSSFDLAGNKVKSVASVFVQGKAQKSQVTEWQYDAGQREIECRQAVGTSLERVTKKTYTKSGELAMIVKPSGVTLHHAYDAQGRLISLSSSDKTVHYTYAYNTLGQLIVAQDKIQKRSTCRTYDEKKQLRHETLATGLTMAYSHDAAGRVTEMTLPDGSTVDYVYDAAFLREVSRKGAVHSFESYDLAGRLLQEKGIAGEITTTYDILGRPLSIDAPGWKEENLSYDPHGNLVANTLTDTNGNYDCSYSYDELDQMLEESGVKKHCYLFDSMNNRKMKDGKKHEINQLNQLLSDGKYRYHYDMNGNLIEKENKQSKIHFYYDALDRLVKVSTDDTDVIYSYDETGRRLTKTKYHNDTLISQEAYLYQGENEIGRVNKEGEIIEFRSLGLGKGSEIGGAVLIELNGNMYLPIHDHNGNVVTLLDDQGSVVESYRYTSFGEEPDGKPSINPWHFSSKRLDQETGFVYFGKRYYDPGTGRWITQDPMGYRDGPNLYAYVHNNPQTHIDPYGLARRSSFTNFFYALFQNEIVREVVGSTIAMIGDHVIPVPIVRDIFSYGGRYIASGSVQFYIREDFSPRPKIGCTNNPELGDKEAVGFINGIMNNVYGVMGTSAMISHTHGGTNVHYMWNASHGLVFDLIRALMHKLYIPTESVLKTTDMIRKLIAQVGGVEGGGRVNLFAHSHGGAILNAALTHLTPEEKKMLHVVTLGSACMISSNGLGECVNYVSQYDPVPFVAGSLGIALGKIGCGGYNVRIIPSKGMPFLDHSIEGDTYRGVIADYGRQFKARNGLQ